MTTPQNPSRRQVVNSRKIYAARPWFSLSVQPALIPDGRKGHEALRSGHVHAMSIAATIAPAIKSFPQRAWTHGERSTVANDALVLGVSDTAEHACAKVNAVLQAFLESAGTESPDAYLIASLEREARKLLSDVSGGETLCAGRLQVLKDLAI